MRRAEHSPSRLCGERASRLLELISGARIARRDARRPHRRGRLCSGNQSLFQRHTFNMLAA